MRRVCGRCAGGTPRSGSPGGFGLPDALVRAAAGSLQLAPASCSEGARVRTCSDMDGPTQQPVHVAIISFPLYESHQEPTSDLLAPPMVPFSFPVACRGSPPGCSVTLCMTRIGRGGETAARAPSFSTVLPSDAAPLPPVGPIRARCARCCAVQAGTGSRRAVQRIWCAGICVATFV